VTGVASSLAGPRLHQTPSRAQSWSTKPSILRADCVTVHLGRAEDIDTVGISSSESSLSFPSFADPLPERRAFKRRQWL
jgi:hypothetical protein